MAESSKSWSRKTWVSSSQRWNRTWKATSISIRNLSHIFVVFSFSWGFLKGAQLCLTSVVPILQKWSPNEQCHPVLMSVYTLSSWILLVLTESIGCCESDAPWLPRQGQEGLRLAPWPLRTFTLEKKSYHIRTLTTLRLLCYNEAQASHMEGPCGLICLRSPQVVKPSQPMHQIWEKKLLDIQ